MGEFRKLSLLGIILITAPLFSSAIIYLVFAELYIPVLVMLAAMAFSVVVLYRALDRPRSTDQFVAETFEQFR